MRPAARRMNRRRARGGTLAALGALLAVGCMATIPVGDDRADEGAERAHLMIGERAFFDGGAVVVTLTGVGVDEAIIDAEVNGIRRRTRIRAGLGGAARYPPYEIRLVSTSISNEATIEVVRR